MQHSQGFQGYPPQGFYPPYGMPYPQAPPQAQPGREGSGVDPDRTWTPVPGSAAPDPVSQTPTSTAAPAQVLSMPAHDV